MPYDIKPIEKDQCVFLAYETQITLAEAEFAHQEVNVLLGGKQWNRLVLDITRSQSIPKAWELFQFSESLFLEVPQSTRIAIVVREDQARYARLIENIARNRGVLLACFGKAENAAEWV